MLLTPGRCDVDFGFETWGRGGGGWGEASAAWKEAQPRERGLNQDSNPGLVICCVTQGNSLPFSGPEFLLFQTKAFGRSLKFQGPSLPSPRVCPALPATSSAWEGRRADASLRMHFPRHLLSQATLSHHDASF